MEASEKQITYELAYLLRLGETEAVIEAALKDAGATVTLKGPINQVQLAYPIKKQGTALFGFFQMTLPTGDAVKAISDALKHNESVVRMLFVKVPKQKAVTAERKAPASAEASAGKPAPDSKTSILPSVGNIDSLSNEKLEETLEEILK